MSKTNDFVFIVIKIVAWIIFVGLCIEAGALLLNFIFSIFKPEMIKNLYNKLDLSQLYAKSEFGFYAMYSFVLILAILKAILFYVVIELSLKLKLEKPFSETVSKLISKMSYYTFSIGILGFIAREVAKKLTLRGFEVDQLAQFWPDSEAFILMAAIIFVIAAIFKRGIDLQNENDLTV